MQSMLILWIIIAVGALAVDLITSSFLFIWFTVGSLASMIMSATGFSTGTQIITFIVVSSVFMAVGYPLVKKTIKKTVPKTVKMEEKYIGKVFIAEEDIDIKATIKIEGIYWTVRNAGRPIKKGQKLKIVGIDGTILLIERDE
jgi:membrane protein implicated in regulation of membrane protease activity